MTIMCICWLKLYKFVLVPCRGTANVYGNGHARKQCNPRRV